MKRVLKQEYGVSCVPRLHGLVAGEMEQAHLAAQQIPRLCVYFTYPFFTTGLHSLIFISYKLVLTSSLVYYRSLLSLQFFTTGFLRLSLHC